MENAYMIEVGPADSGEGSADSLLSQAIAKAGLVRLDITRGRKAEKPVVIALHAGVYELTGTIAATAQISGTETAPTIVTSFPGESATISGGVALTGFTPVRDSAIRDRLSREARDHVLVVDLPRDLVKDLGSINPALGRRPELYHNGVLTQPARYPNDGWLEIVDVPQTGPRMIHPGLDRDTSSVPRGRHFGRFVYPGDRPSRWQPGDDIWVHGYWTWDWSDEFLRVARLDTAAHEITPAEPHHSYGYTKGQRFYFLNVLEELDSPGEWYLDSADRKLYYWPIKNPIPGEVVFSSISTPLLSITGAEHIRIESIRFSAGRGEGVRITGGTSIAISGCVFTNLGGTAIAIDGGTSHSVASCDIHDTGGTGISLEGGNRRTLEPGDHLATNNHIYKFAQRMRTYRPAIQVGGVGNTISHNLIHDAPHMGMNIDGNNHVIEFNEIYRIAQETGDVGAMYMGRDWTERGVIFRFNFIHDLEGPGHIGAMGVYLDDAASGATIYRNLFYRAKRAILIGGGRDITTDGNVFVECEPSISLDARGVGWASGYIVEGGSWRMYEKLRAMHFDAPPYATAYPELAVMLEQEPAMPEGNAIVHNISVRGKWLNLDSKIPGGMVRIEGNTVENLPEVSVFLSHMASRVPGDDLPPVPAGLPDIAYDEIGLYEDLFRTF